MKPASQLKSLRVSRFCLHLLAVLAFCVSPLNTLRAQSPVPDDFNPGANDGVYSLAVQPDGKVVVGGGFTNLAGAVRNRLGRLNADGTLDATFNPGAGGGRRDPSVYSLEMQTDEKILVGGEFFALDEQPRSKIGRLNADGTLDSTFDPGVSGDIDYTWVTSLITQADGKILVGGLFTALGGESHSAFGRLNADATPDSTFNPNPGTSLGNVPEVYALAVQSDGKILVGGSFETLSGQQRNDIGRLNADGTLDNTFDAGPGLGEGSSVAVHCTALAVQADGKILVGGSFETLGGQLRHNIGRLNANGTVDNTFNPGSDGNSYRYVSALAIQADGRILVGGLFSTLGGQPRSNIARLNADGTVDATFDPVANDDVDALALQADGKIVVGGRFTTLGGQPRNRIARLNNTDPATQTLSFSGSTVTWLRGGASPEVWRTTFEHSVDGIGWTKIGSGTRVSGGWQMTGVSVPSGGTLRARGFVSGDGNSSGWFVESYHGVPLLLYQPASTNSNPGESATFNVTAVGTPPLSYQWYHDGTAVPSAVGSWLALQNLSRADAGLYTVVVSNAAGTTTSKPALLTVNLSTLDSTFNPGTSSDVFSLAVQADGKILVGGSFTNFGGQPRSHIARLNADRTLDSSFNPGAGGDNFAFVSTLALQTDGKILVGGTFTNLGGQPRSRLGRLNADGTPDNTFNPGASGSDFPGVYSLTIQVDGKILVGGSFTNLGGQSRDNIGRLNTDGMLDTTFSPGADGPVNSLALQSDGKIVVGGRFTILDGQPRDFIGRLNADGTLDSAFNPGADGDVYTLAVQADGRILVGGGFFGLGGQERHFIGCLNADGTLDSTFNPGADGIGFATVYSLTLQTDGKILVGGGFAILGGQERRFIGRLHADGTLDGTFNPGAEGDFFSAVYTMALQADGRILIGGSFTNLSGQPRDNIGRLNNTDPATQNLDYTGSTITWLRGGTSPEVRHTTFEHSSDGSAWTFLGSGERIPGGWQLAGISLSPTGTLRARGQVAGDPFASGWFVESYQGAPAFISQPASRTSDSGTTVTFTVVAGGNEPLSYQWLKNGVALVDQGNIAGANSGTLTLSGVSAADAESYSVVVTNAKGSATSAVATLTVNSELLDSTFNPGANGAVYSLASQPDGKILVGGFFSSLGGQTRTFIGRLNPDGVLDNTFNPRAASALYSLALQPDGKILVIGLFTNLAGQARDRIGRLNADGTLDGAFNPGADSSVYSLALQADGKIVMGGGFTNLAGQVRNRLGRLNPDGTLDGTFNPGASSFVYSLALQEDGKVLVGGGFINVSGQPRRCLARLNADGTLDSAFNPSAGNTVTSVALQADGKILVGGYFTTMGGQPRARLARLNADGTLDSAFNPGADGPVTSLAAQADGRILVGGSFTNLAGQLQSFVGRLNADGTLDGAFNPRAEGSVAGLALQADGMILMGGSFTNVGGQPRNRIARLKNTDPATQTLRYEGDTITWHRGGTSPEVWRTTFEYSANGSTWTTIGPGTRTATGWQATGVSLPPNAILRARGHVVGGNYNASTWFVETILDPNASIHLSLVRDGSSVVLGWTGGQGPYQVQQTTDTSKPNSWQDVGTPVPTNSMSFPIGPDTLFLRVRGQ